ncbi:hypothetical protein HPB47_026506 [Ixodes persulcatus]|uniref:Uncharacterized protein n=1 Tax=Ixodes persulcatus TaxID=34615 RepID=A0AC60PYI2_IXOPE|nr:hypothetical protein HPB47_026506 [Ixodes persulcatus]
MLPTDLHFLRKLGAVIVTAYYLLYDALPYMVLRSCSAVLVEYLQFQRKKIERCCELKSFHDKTQLSGQLEVIRHHLGHIRDLKDFLNNIWQVPLAAMSAAILLFACVACYAMFHDGLNAQDIPLAVSFCVYSSLAFVDMTLVSQALHDELRYLHETVDPKGMYLCGGGFLRINKSLLVSIASVFSNYFFFVYDTHHLLSMSYGVYSTLDFLDMATLSQTMVNELLLIAGGRTLASTAPSPETSETEANKAACHFGQLDHVIFGFVMSSTQAPSTIRATAGLQAISGHGGNARNMSSNHFLVVMLFNLRFVFPTPTLCRLVDPVYHSPSLAAEPFRDRHSLGYCGKGSPFPPVLVGTSLADRSADRHGPDQPDRLRRSCSPPASLSTLCLAPARASSADRLSRALRHVVFHPHHPHSPPSRPGLRRTSGTRDFMDLREEFFYVDGLRRQVGALVGAV